MGVQLPSRTLIKKRKLDSVIGSTPNVKLEIWVRVLFLRRQFLNLLEASWLAHQTVLKTVSPKKVAGSIPVASANFIPRWFIGWNGTLTRCFRKVRLLHAVEHYDEVAKLVRQQSAKLLQVGSSPILILWTCSSIGQSTILLRLGFPVRFWAGSLTSAAGAIGQRGGLLILRFWVQVPGG